MVWGVLENSTIFPQEPSTNDSGTHQYFLPLNKIGIGTHASQFRRHFPFPSLPCMLLLPLTDDGPSNERMYLSRHLSKSSRFNASRSNIAARNHFYFRVCVTWFRFSPKSPGNLPELRRALPSSSPPHVAPLTAIPFTLQLLHGRQVPRMFQHHHCVQPCPGA